MSTTDVLQSIAIILIGAGATIQGGWVRYLVRRERERQQ